jgi:hypothetical protein
VKHVVPLYLHAAGWLVAHLGHEHEVDEVGGEGRMCGDEARVTPHELDHTDALGARCGFSSPLAYYSLTHLLTYSLTHSLLYYFTSFRADVPWHTRSLRPSRCR